MFLKKFYYFTLAFLIAASSQASFADSCAGGFSESETGLESYRQLLVRLAQSSLGVTSLTPQQIKALEMYHHVVRGGKGTDGTFARVGNYTFPQRRRIVRFLREVFSSKQVATLIEGGIVEINRTDPEKIRSNKQIRYFLEGNTTFVIVNERPSDSDKIHQGKVRLQEETDDGLLLEVEKINYESGKIVKEQWFIAKQSNNSRFDSFSEVDKILEKTNNGFVIERKNGDIAFFSFESAINNGLLPKNPTSKNYRELEDILNRVLSDQLDQISALEEAFSEGVLDKDHSTYTDFIKLLDKSIVEDGYYLKDIKVTLNPEMELVFLAVQSTRRKISISDLNLPPPRSRETQLREQGYKPSYIAEIDKVNEWAIVRKQLQKLRANPYTTHIEYFADQIPAHIAHIRKGLEDNYSPKEESQGNRSDQLQKLKDLEEEAKQAVADEKVTYKWWLEFNNKLAEVISGMHDPQTVREVQAIIEATLSYFPLKAVIPTIKEEIGIITFNRASLEGVYPASLINRQTIEADGQTYSAFLFLLHDHFHASLDGNQIYREYSFGHRLFHKRLLQNIEGLPIDKRKKAEVIYFLMTHEYEKQGVINISYSDKTPEEIKNRYHRKYSH